jgi:hypothetical protein
MPPTLLLLIAGAELEEEAELEEADGVDIDTKNVWR